MRNALVPTDERVPRYLVWASVALALLTGVETLLRVLGVANSGSDLVLTGEFSIGLVTTVPFVAAIGYAGHWLARSDLDPEHYRRIAVWTVGGTAMFLAINLALVAFVPVSVWVLVAWVRWAVALGGGISVLVGISEARAIQGALEAERGAGGRAPRGPARRLRVRQRPPPTRGTEHRQRHLRLRHDAEGRTLPRRPELRVQRDTIQRQSQDMATVVRDVRVLLDAMAGDPDLEPTNLEAVLADEVAKLKDAYERVEVDTSVPEGVYVRANALLPRVFGNLLSNAVEHNDSDVPRVSVVVEASADTVTVEIADDGPGLPEGTVDTLFERSTTLGADHGIGLYLVSMLVDSYGGTIEPTETGPDGSTFAVELPRAQSPPDDRVASAATVSVPA